MSLESVLERIGRDPLLPTPPPLALRVLEKASRPDCSLADVAWLIRHDPGLCAKLLKVVNSAFFALPNKVTVIGRALSLLGPKRVRALVLGLALPSMQRRGAGDSDHWRMSVAAAMAAREWAVTAGDADPDSEMLAALLCDVGALVLRQVFPREYARVLAHPASVLVWRQCELEEEHIGANHAEVGAHLLRGWGLPESITEAVRYHHRPEALRGRDPIVRQRASRLYFANLIGQLQLAPDDSALLGEMVRLAEEDFHLDAAHLAKFLEPLQAKIEEFAALLNVEVGPTLPYPALLTRSTDQLVQLTSETVLENIRVRGEKDEANRLRQQAEEELRLREEQLRQSQKMEAIGRLAGGVAHDFNNLLTIISGYGDLLNGMLDARAPGRELVGEILKAADRAAALTRQLLAFSRRQVLAPRVLALNGVLGDMDKMLRRLIGEDIELQTVLASDLAPIEADPSQIEQILLNLAVNARDAMPRGGRLTIETANVQLDEAYAHAHPEARAGSFVRLTVTDTGCGMDAATQARIFEPFFTTKEVGKGTGLGLATVYGIVQQSEGSIHVRSEPGRGASFQIYLPRAAEAPVVAAPQAASPVRPIGKETLLVVEDEDAVRALTLAVLRGSGYEILEAVDADDALRRVEQQSAPIHLLVTDVIMPGMSGRELAERLTAGRPELKVLYVSGYTDDAVVRHGLREAEVAFLQKPFTPDALARKVREVLDGPSGRCPPQAISNGS